MNFSTCASPAFANSIPFENSLIPLYSGGLWEAVIIAPLHFSLCVPYASMGVGAIPMSMTSQPESIAPAASASARMGEVERVSVASMSFFQAPRQHCPLSWQVQG
jgi:hypothetical protein